MKMNVLALLCLVPTLVCCDPKPIPVTEDPMVTINGDKQINVGCDEGSFTVSFTANRDWTVTPDDDWITVEPESGTASTSAITVTVSYGRNPSTAERDTYFLIAADEAREPVTVIQAGDPYAGAATELKSGDVVLACSPLVEKFLTEVNYEDKTYNKDTKVFDYYGGFDGVNLTWANWETEWPDGDKPQSYSIRWKESDLESGAMMLHLEDALAWSGDMEIAAGSRYVNITNLVPNDKYNYKVTAASGKVIAQGSFSTTGSLHQVFFHGKVQKRGGKELKGSGARNARDLGGWKTLDGKTVKYRKVYRGGRLNEKWSPYPLDAQGEKEVLFEGIGAQLDLRGNSDVMFESAVTVKNTGKELDHCAPVIEQGGKTMLVSDAAKTRECFEFVVNSLRKNKPVYFHCSLGRDRTGTLDILLLGLLGVREGVIAKEYEVTYFAPVGYSVSSSDKSTNTKPIFKNTRMQWVYSDVVPYFWELAGEGGTFAQGVEKYLLTVAGVSQKDIDDFRNMMLE